MKTNLRCIAGTAACAALLSFTLTAQAAPIYSDDFSSLNDSGWTHMNMFALSTLQTWDASSGAYRMTAPMNGFNPGTGKYGFVGSSPTGISVTDCIVQSDVVAFQGPGGFGAFGVGTRLQYINTPLGMTGYAFVYEPFGNNYAGAVTLYRVGPPGDPFNGLGSANVSLSVGSQYRLTISAFGDQISGSIFDAGGGLLATVAATDPNYTTGGVGLLGLGQQPMPTLDFTMDNFMVVVPEPGSALLIGLGLAGLLALRRGRA